ncbi:MAG: hypothetical protein M0R03_03785 [Novosphingobium sp.]|jgi:hypothetical protein|nr:hypothetical protein [Novosphingobium sp.]
MDSELLKVILLGIIMVLIICCTKIYENGEEIIKLKNKQKHIKTQLCCFCQKEIQNKTQIYVPNYDLHCCEECAIKIIKFDVKDIKMSTNDDNNPKNNKTKIIKPSYIKKDGNTGPNVLKTEGEVKVNKNDIKNKQENKYD